MNGETTRVPETDRADKGVQRLILRGGLASGFGFVTRFGARFLFLFVAGQLYGAVAYGAFALGVAIVELGSTIGAVGTKKILYPLLDRNEAAGTRPAAHVVVDAAILVTLVSLGLATLLIAILAVLPASVIDPRTALVMALLAPAICGQSLLDLLAASTRWKHLMRYEVVSRSLIEPYVGVAAAAGAYAAGFDEIGLVISYWCGTIVALLYLAAGAGKTYGRLDLLHYRTSAGALRGILRGSSANTASDFVNALFARLDLYLAGILLGEGATGIYAMARQLRTPVRQVRQSLDTLLMPITAHTLERQGTGRTALALASATRLVLAVQIPVLLVLFAIGEPLLSAFGREFAAGYVAMLIVTTAEVIQGAFGLSSLILVYRQPRAGLRLTMIWTLVGLVAGVALIPTWGIEGAAASVLLAYSGMALHRRLMLARGLDVRVPARHGIGPILAGVAGLGAALATMSLEPVGGGWAGHAVIAMVSLAVYAALLFIWSRISGERLSMSGFVARADAAQASEEAVAEIAGGRA